jgi:hypothetical protein
MRRAANTESVGRKYEYVRYAMLSRKVGGDGEWYGRDNYRTLEEARKVFQESLKGGRYQDVGGIAVDFGPDDGTRYERKLVRVVKQCEVISIGVGPA